MILTLALALVASAGGLVGAHDVAPETVIAKIASSASRAELGIVTVERSPAVSRLLVVGVGAKWETVPVALRQARAEEWFELWRHAVAQGIVAVVDAKTGLPVINFDAHGRAVVKAIPPPTS